MASWYSNILTKTTSQISSLRSTLLASDADGDTEDDTHVCRVLRAYYLDAGRALPTWLPGSGGQAVAAASSNAASSNPTANSAYGHQTPQNASNAPLSSLWDSAATPAPASAQDRLRQRLWGAPRSRGASPAPDTARQPPAARQAPDVVAGARQTPSPQGMPSSGRHAPPPQQNSSRHAPQMNHGGARQGEYEDRFAPGGAYDARRVPEQGGGVGARQGLPAGPRRGAAGLPSGPRGYR